MKFQKKLDKIPKIKNREILINILQIFSGKLFPLCRLGCGMPFDAVRPKNSIDKLSVPSKEAAWHLMSKGFQNGISQFEKKNQTKFADLVPQFWQPEEGLQKIRFSCGRDPLAAYVEQLLLRGKAAVCCILPHGIVWTHLNTDSRTRVKCENIFCVLWWQIMSHNDAPSCHDDTYLKTNENNEATTTQPANSVLAKRFCILIEM